MARRRVFDEELHAHFITFSCYRRRRLLDDDRAKRVVLDVFGLQLSSRKGSCVGYVVMPDHVHAIVWFPHSRQLSVFIQQWKRLSSYRLRRFLRNDLPEYASCIPSNDPIWQREYYAFNLYDEEKVREKLNYMHANPVKAGLAERPADWIFSSARFYEWGADVGVSIRWIG